MTILVTGATGFVGAAVVRALRRHGQRVLALVRDANKTLALQAAGIEIAIGDMWRPETYEPLVKQVDVVVHAAQQSLRGRWGSRQILTMHESDALMTRTLARACLDQAKPFVYSSGALTHGGSGRQWTDEASPPNPCFVAQGHAKMVEELTSLQRSHGLRLLVMSPGFVYGSGGFVQMTAELIRRRQYYHLGCPENYWSLVHVDDLGEAYALAIEQERYGQCYFVGDDEPLTRRDVVDQLADGLGCPRVRRAPGWLMGVVLGFPMIEAATASIRLRNDKLKRELGWQPCYATFSKGLPVVLQQLSASSAGLAHC